MASESDRSLSVPIQLFINGFGVFRNTYRSLKGFYLTPACLPYLERRREKSIFTLTLGPHGAEMTDIVKCFEAEIQDLEKGVKMKINGIETMVNVFIRSRIPRTYRLSHHGSGVVSCWLSSFMALPIMFRIDQNILLLHNMAGYLSCPVCA